MNSGVARRNFALVVSTSDSIQRRPIERLQVTRHHQIPVREALVVTWNRR